MNSTNVEKEAIRKVDKTQIPTCNIWGVEIAAINMGWLVKYIKKNIKYLSGDYITVANVHTTVTAADDSEYLSIQNGGIMAIPDGGPLSSVGRKRGYKSMERTTGPSLMEEIFKISAEEEYRHFFYGATDETLKRLKKQLEKKYPEIQIAGMYSPPFKKEVTLEKEEILQKINESNADFVWVGLGAPKQERWMALHQWRVKGLMIGVGAGFDYHAGKLKRAPLWMQRLNLEWLYRLLQDPKRLFKRYAITNMKFIWNVIVRRQ